jgi:hypothetical protein
MLREQAVVHPKTEKRWSMIVDFDRIPFGADKGIAPLIDGEGARGYYRAGYFACARAAAQSLFNSRGDNASAMPVLFLYRHYLELALKDILDAAGAFAIELSDKKFGHDIAALWAEVRPLVISFGVAPSDADDRTIAEMADLDKRADAFRYALDNKGERHFKGIGSVDVGLLISALDSLAQNFEATIDQMHEDEAEMDNAIARAVERDPW